MHVDYGALSAASSLCIACCGGSAQAHVPRVGTPEYWRPADPVVVLDPLNPSNNLGRSCFGFRHIQVAPALIPYHNDELYFDNLKGIQTQVILESALRDVEQFVSNGGLEAAEAGSMCSALGAMFGTHHHIHVVKFTAQMWCPDELFPLSSSHLTVPKDFFLALLPHPL